MKHLFDELRRRNVLRTVAIYAGAAWLLVQVATQVFPFFDVPNWAVRWVILATLAGLPVAAGLSWFYELTPQGLKRESELDRSAAVSGAGRRPIPRVWALVWALVGLTVLAAAAVATLRRHAGPANPAPVAIAVMPFKTLNDDKNDAYFTDGIQDEILTRLADIRAFKVISRTSTAYYASRPADLRQIAQQLGVTHIVEGGVQRQGERVRIAVQLIAAASDSEIWAQTYDRMATNIFDVESEVARAIADALQAKLSGQEKNDLARVPTNDPNAYDAYLRGIAYRLRSLDTSNLAPAADWFQKAVEYDPDFALAWARLAQVDANRAYYGRDLQHRPCQRARQAADTANSLNPSLGESSLATGYVRFMCDDDPDAAERAFVAARARLPNNAEVLQAMSQIDWRRGDWLGVLSDLRDATALDPRNPELLGSYALYLGTTRQFDAARGIANRALNITPDDASMLALQVILNQAEGRLDEAGAALATMALQPSNAGVFDYQMLQLLYRGHYAEAISALQAAIGGNREAVGISIGDYYYLLANADTAAGHPEAARQAYADGTQALREYDQAAIADGSSGGVYLRSMLCLMETGRAADALSGDDCSRLRRIADSDSQFSLTALDALAQAETLAGNLTAASDSVARLLAKPYSSSRYTVPLTPALLRQDPLWAPLRGSPRFAKLAGG